MSPHPLPRRPGHSKSAYQRNTKTSRLWCVCLFDCPGESTERGEDCNLLRATSPLAGQSRHPPPDLCPRQSAVRCDKPRQTATDRGTKEAQPFAVHLFVQTKHLQKAGPSSVARLKMDLPFHDRLAFTGEVPALLTGSTVDAVKHSRVVPLPCHLIVGGSAGPIVAAAVAH